jgi:hypothetical protein
MTGAVRRLSQIWSLKNYVAPVFTKKVTAPAVTACWDACGFGYYTGDCETTGVGGGVLS